MKRFGLFLLVTMAAAIFTSCNDSDGDYPRLSAFATVKPLENNDFFVVLDDGKTVYPGDKSRIGSYKAEEGQRGGGAAQQQGKGVNLVNLIPGQDPARMDHIVSAFDQLIRVKVEKVS